MPYNLPLDEHGISRVMSSRELTLLDLKPGERAEVLEILGGWGITRRLMELGLFPGTKVKVISGGPFAGPVYLEVEPTGVRVSVGRGAASRVLVRRL